MTRITLALLLICWLFPALSFAQVEEPLCMSKVKNEEDINICQYATAKYLELQVKETEEKVLLRFSGIQLQRFQETQANWRLMVSLDCEIQSYFYEGAGIYAAIQSQCLQKHYASRLDTLRNYLCPEHQYLNGCASDTTQQPNQPR